jgi:hypothetical protein
MSKENEIELVEHTTTVELTDHENIKDTPLQAGKPDVDSKVVDEGVANRQSIYDKYNTDSRPKQVEVQDVPNVEDVKKTEVVDEEVVDPPAPETYKVKIYGQERFVDKKIVDAEGGVKAYQIKVAAAEKAQIERDRQFIEQETQRLAQEKRDLEKLKQELPNRESPGNKNGDLPSDDHAKRAELKAAIEAAGASLLDGELGEFSEKLSQYIAERPDLGKSESPVDVDRIVREVEQRTIENMTKQQRAAQLREAVEIFAVEFPEIASDPDLFAKTDRRTLLLQQENPGKTPLEIVRLAGEEVRRAYVAPRISTPTTTSRDSKLAEKRAMSKPTGGSDRAVAPPEPKQPTRSDYVLQLQKQRGQA